MADRRLVANAREAWERMGRTHFVYLAFDQAGELLYIGQTRRPHSRAEAHRSSSPWFQDAARFRMLGPYSKSVALTLERRLIEQRQPAHNVKWVSA